MTATLTTDRASGADAAQPENRVRGFSPLSWPRVGLDVPFSPESVGDFPLHLRRIASEKQYDPSSAQFLSRDPAVAATRSPYAYVAGDPLNRTDPAGLDPRTTDTGGDNTGWGDVSGGGPIDESTMWKVVEEYLGPDYQTIQGSPDNLIFRSTQQPNMQIRYDFNENELHFEEVLNSGKITENAHIPVKTNEPTPSPGPPDNGGGGGVCGAGITSAAGCVGVPGLGGDPFPGFEPVPVPGFVPVFATILDSRWCS